MPRSSRPFRIETVAKAVSRRSELVRRLHRSSAVEASVLVNRLQACSGANPCRSGACPVCLRRLRRALLREAPAHFSGRSIVRVSWIPPGGAIAIGELRDFHLSRYVAKMLRALQRLLPPGIVAVGGIDFSLNVENNMIEGWQAQGYALIGIPSEGVSTTEMISTLRARLPLGRNARRPVRISLIDEADDLPRTLSYAMKAGFYRRSSYQYFRRVTGRPAWNTRPQALPSDAAVELALFLDRFPIGDRLLLVGVRRFGPPTNFTLRANALLSSRSSGPNRPRLRQ